MNDAKLFKLAKAGAVGALLDAIGAGGESGDDDDDEDDGASEVEVDDAAYRWLQIAADFGAKRARDMADDMLETSSLRYDDGGMVVGLIHLELGQAYLRGEPPVPTDHAKAKYHLERAKQAAIDETTDAAKGFDVFRKKIPAEARAIFDAYFRAKAAKKVAKKVAAKKKAPARRR